MHDHFAYPGQELLLFENARNWKQYFSSFIKPYIKNHVLEVGAGRGANTLILNTGYAKEWVLAEPDTFMSALLQKKITEYELPTNCKVVTGTISQIEKNEHFDTILYIDVLEHIPDDRSEIENAVDLLKPGGHLIILSPAIQYLYSRFDKAIGHHRRYNKRQLKKIIPSSLSKVRLHYFDSCGFFMSMANRFLLRQKYPTKGQVNFWNSIIVPISRIVDRMVFFSFGKTILGIWEKEYSQQ